MYSFDFRLQINLYLYYNTDMYKFSQNYEDRLKLQWKIDYIW